VVRKADAATATNAPAIMADQDRAGSAKRLLRIGLTSEAPDQKWCVQKASSRMIGIGAPRKNNRIEPI
jgi:hypothetical protein